MAYKRWIYSEIDKEMAKNLAEECSIEPLLALLLSARGYTDPFDVDMFLSRDVPDFDPFGFPDMEKAVERINEALEKKEKIIIYGDYDCDGVTSTALLYKFLSSLEANVDFYIPSRLNEGYGMSGDAINKLASEGVKLIITVDNGINSVAEIDKASSLGIDVVVTDHHIQAGELPKAVAVVNPHRNDSQLLFKDYAGVGVAFMLALAVSGLPPVVMLRDYADLVALGTIADVMPLREDNRSFALYGINKINKNPSVGIKALLAAAGAKLGEITSGTVAFTAAPRINAAGRLGDALRAVKLLVTESYAECFEIAATLDDENRNRQSIEADIVKFAEADVLNNRLYDNRVIVVAGKGWHEGVLGIAAARIAERFGKPTILLSLCEENSILKGSARSVGDFSIFTAIDSCKDLLIKYGGHDKAAGLSLNADDLDIFKTLINKNAKNQCYPIPSLHIDLKLNPAAISKDLVYTLLPLEPYGTENPKPVFSLCSMKIVNIISVANGKHIRIIATKNNTTVAMVAFGVSPEAFPFKIGDIADFAVTIELKMYQGEEQLSVYVKDFKPSNIPDNHQSDMLILEAFREKHLSPEETKKLIFNRNDLAVIYRAIKEGKNTFLKLSYSITDIPLTKIYIMLKVMEELGIISLLGAIEESKILILPSPKVDLFKSEIYSNLLKMGQ